MITLYLPNGDAKKFAHDIDAMEWAAAGLASVEPATSKKPAPKAEPKVEEVKTVVEAIEEQAAPGEVIEAPAPAAKPAPRRRKSTES